MDIANEISDAMDSAVAPLDRSYCNLFYILAIVSIMFFAVLIISIVYTGLKKKMPTSFYVIAIIYSSQLLIVYIQNRLLYNMCKGEPTVPL